MQPQFVQYSCTCPTSCLCSPVSRLTCRRCPLESWVRGRSRVPTRSSLKCSRSVTNMSIQLSIRIPLHRLCGALQSTSTLSVPFLASFLSVLWWICDYKYFFCGWKFDTFVHSVSTGCVREFVRGPHPGSLQSFLHSHTSRLRHEETSTAQQPGLHSGKDTNTCVSYYTVLSTGFLHSVAKFDFSNFQVCIKRV